MARIKATLYFCIPCILTFYALGASTNFSGAFLLETGWSNTSVGFFLTLISVISIAGQFVFTQVVNRLRHLTPPYYIAIISCGSMLCGIGAYFAANRWLVSVFICGMSGFMAMLAPLMDSLGVYAMSRNPGTNYGLGRGMGSIAYGVSASVIGLLFGRIGRRALPMILIAINALLILCLLRYGHHLSKQPVQQAAEAAAKKTKGVFRNRAFMLFLLASIMVYVSHSTVQNYFYQIILSKGGDSSDVGALASVASFCEIPVMFLYTILSAKISHRVFVKVSECAIVLKAICILLVREVPLLFYVQMIQLVGFGMYRISSLFYVRSWLSQEDVIQGVALLAACETASSLLSSSCGGFLLDRAGISTLLITAIVISSIGCAIHRCIIAYNRKALQGSPDGQNLSNPQAAP